MAAGEVVLLPSGGDCGCLVGWAPVPSSVFIFSRYNLFSHMQPQFRVPPFPLTCPPLDWNQEFRDVRPHTVS